MNNENIKFSISNGLQVFIKKFKDLPIIKKYLISFFVVILILLSFYIFLKNPPRNYPINTVFTINEGQSLQNITNNLYQNNIIKHPLVFRSAVILMGGERNVIAGNYFLDKKENPVTLAYRLMNGDFNTDILKITIPEGWNIFKIADHLEKNIKNFNKDEFIRIAKEKEGYLFPDTYFIEDTARPEFIVNLMNKNFENKIKNVNSLATSTRDLEDIIIMASILEGEANTMESKKIVSGILWKRLEVGMPLQVDATFSYVNGKNTFELTLDDLQIDSPYNTYKYKGLPPGPISNPGLNAINSALNPTQTRYLYFLTGKDGKMYYSRTFEEHKTKKQLHLK